VSDTTGALTCPACGARGSEVVDSRAHPDGSGIRRRRKCLHCRERYTTYETVIDPTVLHDERTRAKAVAVTLRDMANALEAW
jgi:transcriptional regulator NrdR family protein